MIMLKNNNSAVITRMARRSLSGNRRRSVIMIVAVALSSFLLFSVFTVGATYFKMYHIQNIRLNGNDSDAIMYGVTEEQEEMCRKNPDIEAAGINALAGYVVSTEKDETPNVSLMWADEIYWDTMMEPAREWVKGEYPSEVNEVMVSEEALQKSGLDGLEIGDNFTMTYDTYEKEETGTFRISGIWEGYGPNDVFYMSKAFYDQAGYQPSDVRSGRYFIEFKKKIMTKKEQDTFIQSMELGKQQSMFFYSEYGYFTEILMGMAGLILVTCLCAYLLIYNILYLSVDGNIRYYGLLQTVGMTGRQVKQLMHRQMIFIGTIGIMAGLFLGSAVSFFLIPVVIHSLGIQSGTAGKIQVTFHPAIFLFATLLVGVTIFIAARKPTKKAVSISPVEALGYCPVTGRKKTRRTKQGQILWRMAREQLTKDKKKSGIIMLSLAASLSVFLCLTTLIESQGPRMLVSNYMGMDMVIQNDTLRKEDHGEWKQLIDERFLSNIREKESVKEVHPFLSAEIIVPWEPDFADTWMREFYATWMGIPYEDDLEEYKEHPENFGSILVGIDETEFDYLNSTLETPVDKEEFVAGKTCILCRDRLDFKNSDLAGQKVTCAEYADVENTRTFEIAGLTDETYYHGPVLGCPPTIIVSDSVVKSLVTEPFVYKVGIRYNKEYDETVEAVLKALMQDSPYAKNFSYESKIDETASIKKAQGNLMEVGFGIVLILALIGIMNYVNTTAGNIQSRQVELSIMESIGMTQKQVKKMLILEGILLAGGAVLLTLTLGLGVTYLVYQSMNYMGVPFEIPVILLMSAIIVIILICIVIPLVIYRNLESKGTLVERIRGFE